MQNQQEDSQPSSSSPSSSSHCCEDGEEAEKVRGGEQLLPMQTVTEDNTASGVTSTGSECVGFGDNSCSGSKNQSDTRLSCLSGEEENTSDTAPQNQHAAGSSRVQSLCSSSDCRSKVNNLETSHVIPGVEHTFFEEELEKMEHSSTDKIIILAVDGGAHSELAFQFYKDNVDRPGYFLHVLHHSDVWSHYTPTEGGPSADHCKELAEKAKGVVDEVEEKYKKLMEAQGIKGKTVVLHGKDAWHDILQHQEQSNAMMIVMGTRGHGALSRTFRGSVSDSVVHHAPVPVLVCCHPKEHH